MEYINITVASINENMGRILFIDANIRIIIIRRKVSHIALEDILGSDLCQIELKSVIKTGYLIPLPQITIVIPLSRRFQDHHICFARAVLINNLEVVEAIFVSCHKPFVADWMPSLSPVIGDVSPLRHLVPADIH